MNKATLVLIASVSTLLMACSQPDNKAAEPAAAARVANAGRASVRIGPGKREPRTKYALVATTQPLPA